MIELTKETIIKIKKLYDVIMKIDKSNPDCLENLFTGEKLLIRNNYIGVLLDTGYYQLYASVDFDDVHVGDKGGLLSEDSCLADNSHSWVYHGAVINNSSIYGNVKIKNIKENPITIDNSFIAGNVIITDNKSFFNFETNNHSDKIIDGDSVVVYNNKKGVEGDYPTIYFYKYYLSGDNVIEIVDNFRFRSSILEDRSNIINTGSNAILLKNDSLADL